MGQQPLKLSSTAVLLWQKTCDCVSVCLAKGTLGQHQVTHAHDQRLTRHVPSYSHMRPSNLTIGRYYKAELLECC